MAPWIHRLKEKWKLKNAFQVIIVLLVFTCTGLTVLLIKEPILLLVAPPEERTWLFSAVYYLLIFPIYNVVLLFYGFIFGQFHFFWDFEKRMLNRIFKRP